MVAARRVRREVVLTRAEWVEVNREKRAPLPREALVLPLARAELRPVRAELQPVRAELQLARAELRPVRAELQPVRAELQLARAELLLARAARRLPPGKGASPPLRAEQVQVMAAPPAAREAWTRLQVVAARRTAELVERPSVARLARVSRPA